jgi:DNA polymerase III delta subunit
MANRNVNSSGGYVYILYGEDTFGRDEAVLRLKEKIRELPAGDHNLTELGPETTVHALRMAADVMPFLADRRMVIVHGLLGRLAGRGSGARRAPRARKSATTADSVPDESQQLLEYLPDVPQTTSLVFVEDGRLQPGPLAQVIPRGRSAVREYPAVRDVPHWTRARAKQIGVELDESAVRELAMLGGSDLRRLDSELHKLADYAAGRPVTRGDVRELVVGREVDTWALLDGLSERNTARVLTAYRSLCTHGEKFGAIFGGAIVPHFHRLLAAHALSTASREERARVEVAALGMNPATVDRWIKQSAAFDRAELERAMELLLDLDRQIKVGETEDEAALEVVLVQLCERLALPA